MAAVRPAGPDPTMTTSCAWGNPSPSSGGAPGLPGPREQEQAAEGEDSADRQLAGPVGHGVDVRHPHGADGAEDGDGGADDADDDAVDEGLGHGGEGADGPVAHGGDHRVDGVGRLGGPVRLRGRVGRGGESLHYGRTIPSKALCAPSSPWRRRWPSPLSAGRSSASTPWAGWFPWVPGPSTGWWWPRSWCGWGAGPRRGPWGWRRRPPPSARPGRCGSRPGTTCRTRPAPSGPRWGWPGWRWGAGRARPNGRRSGRPGRLGNEEGDPDGAGPGVGADDRPHVSHHDPVAGVDLADHVEERLDVGGGRVEHGQMLDLAGLADLVDQVAQGPAPGALARLGLHLAVDDLHDRLDRQHGAEEGLGPPDPPTPTQVVEGVEGAVQPGAGDQVLHRSGHVVEGLAGRRGPGGGEHDEALGHGEGLGVDDPHRDAPGHGVGGGAGRLPGGRQGGGQGDDHHPGGALGRRPLVGLLEGAGGRGRRLRQGAGSAPLPELGGGQVAPVDQLLVAEADGEGDDVDAELADQVVGEVAGAVGDYPDSGHAAPSLSAPGAGQGSRGYWPLLAVSVTFTSYQDRRADQSEKYDFAFFSMVTVTVRESSLTVTDDVTPACMSADCWAAALAELASPLMRAWVPASAASWA